MPGKGFFGCFLWMMKSFVWRREFHFQERNGGERMGARGWNLMAEGICARELMIIMPRFNDQFLNRDGCM